MLRFVAAGAIGGYQQYISPHKGFRCAYGAATGRPSCSEYARRVVLRLGVAALFSALPRQFARCRSAFAQLQAESAAGRRRRKARRSKAEPGDCTPSHCSCEPPRSCGRGGDALDCDGPCDVDLPCDCSP